MIFTKPKLLVLGEYAYGTGFDRVTRHILHAAMQRFEVHLYAIGFKEEALTDSSGVHVHPYQSTNSDRYATRGFGELANELDAACILVFFDLTFLRYQLEALRHLKKRIPVVAYQALDGHIFKRRKLISHLKKLDLCVWFTEFAHREVMDALAEQPSLLDRPVWQEVIPHGVDTEVFHPLHKDPAKARLEARNVVFPGLSDPENAFIVMNGNRIYMRKRHDLTYKAFAEFARGKPDNVYLYLHLSDCDPDRRKAVREGAERHGFADRLLIGPPLEGGPVDNVRLNLYYNACDVGITTTAGEGWGLVSCEHGAAGVPQIVPRHTSHPEIWRDAALYLEARLLSGDQSQAVWHYEPEWEDALEHLDSLYKDPGLRLEMGKKALARMSDPYFDWQRIESRWADCFDRIAGKRTVPTPTASLLSSINTI